MEKLGITKEVFVYEIALAQLDMGFEDKGFAMKTCVELMEKSRSKRG